MDEILYPAPRGRREATAPAKPSFAERMEDLRRRYDEFLFRWDEFKQHHQIRPKGFLLAALLIGAVSTAATLYTPGYAVMVNGQELGVVADKAQFEAIEDQVEARASEILGREYSMDSQVSYKRRIVNKRDLSSADTFEDYLFNQVNEVTPGYVLAMGDQVLSVQVNGQ